jgi:hypothetical protein
MGPGADSLQVWKYISQDDMIFVSFNQCLHACKGDRLRQMEIRDLY